MRMFLLKIDVRWKCKSFVSALEQLRQLSARRSVGVSHNNNTSVYRHQVRLRSLQW